MGYLTLAQELTGVIAAFEAAIAASDHYHQRVAALVDEPDTLDRMLRYMQERHDYLNRLLDGARTDAAVLLVLERQIRHERG